jgi:hypothetical protein
MMKISEHSACSRQLSSGWFRIGKPGHDATRLDVLADQDVELAGRGFGPGRELERGVVLHVGV